MTFNKVFLASAIALAALSGCGNSKSSDGAAVANATTANPAVEDSGPVRGTPANTMNVTDRKLLIDGSPVDRADDSHFQGFPRLASHVSEAWLATRAVLTVEGNLEVYDNDTLLMIIANPMGNASILYSRSGFSADKISFSRTMEEGDQSQGRALGMLRFELSECMVDQGQDQGQQDKGEQDKGEQDKGEQDKGEQDKGEQDKGEQDKGQSGQTLVGAVGQGEQDKGEQDKGEQDKGEQEQGDKQVCKNAIVEISLEEVITKEPDQGQDQGQQDKGEQDKGEQDKGEQDKGEQDKGEQDKGEQDKGEQDKGEQDKGEQDKGEQDKGEQDKGEQDKGEQDKGQQGGQIL